MTEEKEKATGHGHPDIVGSALAEKSVAEGHGQNVILSFTSAVST